MFASNTLVGPEREVTLRARERALELGRPLCFDPNLRLERWPSAEDAVAAARGCLEGCLLVKANAAEARLLDRRVETLARPRRSSPRWASSWSSSRSGADGALARGAVVARGCRPRRRASCRRSAPATRSSASLLARLQAAGWDPRPRPRGRARRRGAGGRARDGDVGRGRVGGVGRVGGDRRRVRRIRDRLRERLRHPGGAAARPRARRADPDRALPVDQRPQPRRRLPAPAAALPGLGGRPRRPQRGGRGGDPPRRDLQGQVAAHPGDPARAPGSARRPAPARPRLPALAPRRRAARRRPACCCSPTASATSRSTRTSRAWARASACSGQKAPFEEMHDEMLAITPRGQELEFHVNLLRHGRRTCHARRPAV